MGQTQSFYIRPAREEDRDALATMWIDFLKEQAALDPRFVVSEDAVDRWRNDFPEWIGATVHGLFAAESDGELIGFASVHLWYPAPIYRSDLEAYLDELFVRPEWRRRGVATALLDAVREWAGDRQALRIRLGVLGANTGGQAFWRRRGATAFVETLLIEI